MNGGRRTIIIDRVVLRGVDAHQAQALTASLKQELARILATPEGRAAFGNGQHAPVLRLGRLPLGTGTAGARRFGVGVARAIGKGMRS
jgi:hypothetical protein